MNLAVQESSGTNLGHIRVVMIDDHAMLRDSLATWLEQESDIEIVAVAGDAGAGLEMVIDTMPDIVLMDIDMPGMSCFEAARQITRQLPDVRIIFLSAFTNDSYIEQALTVQARGYLAKREEASVIVDAVRTVARGGVHFSPEVRNRIVVDDNHAWLDEDSQATRGSKLTVRELEVLRYIARGLAKKEIGATMDLSVKTVENHSNNIMAKLDIHNRVDLTRYAIREGLAEA